RPRMARHDTPLLVLYGSNFGTAEEVADQLAGEAEARGFASTVAPLDERVDDLPQEGVLLITTSTYNGTPPDNARRFKELLASRCFQATASAPSSTPCPLCRCASPPIGSWQFMPPTDLRTARSGTSRWSCLRA